MDDATYAALRALNPKGTVRQWASRLRALPIVQREK
jgi:hypothetical protein